MRSPTPLQFWMASTQFGLLMAETQMVMAYRLMGMAGIWATTEVESHTMVTEKVPAFTEAYFGATRAALLGQRSDEILGAWVRPLRKRTRLNSRRLGKLGPTRR